MLTDPTPTVSLLLGLPPAVFAAVVAASTAVVVAVLGQFLTARRERDARRDERRRVALTEVQDAALAVRGALRVYGLTLRSDLDQPLGPRAVRVDVEDGDLHAAEGLLDVRLVRLSRDHAAVAEAVRTWRRTAREHFISPTEVFATEEQERWHVLHQAVKEALTT